MSAEGSSECERHPLDGAKFLHPDGAVNEDNWPRNPSDYKVTRRFRSRFKELKGIVNGDNIDDAFKYGELIKASEGCVAFVLHKEGYTISIIVDKSLTRGMRSVETIWPYIYDEEEVRDSGALSSKQIWRIEQYVGEHKSNWEDARR